MLFFQREQNGACDASEVSSSRGPLRGNVGQSDRLVMPVIEEVTIARVGPYWVEMGITRSDGRDGSTLRNQLRSVIAGTVPARGEDIKVKVQERLSIRPVLEETRDHVHTRTGAGEHRAMQLEGPSTLLSAPVFPFPRRFSI